jgi:DnaJ-class molecular chaperone
VIERQNFTVQLQRHHVPGWLYPSWGTGSLDINVPDLNPPDVYFRLRDAPGQPFVRCQYPSLYTLAMTVELPAGWEGVTIQGIDGREIYVMNTGPHLALVPNEGMPYFWHGIDRGDLLVRFIQP